MKKYKCKIIVSLILITSFIVISISSSYSLFNYQVKGKVKNEIVTGDLTFHYTDNTLKSLDIDSCDLVPDFSSGNNNYTCPIETEISKINITAEANSKLATILGTGTYEILEGENNQKISVTSKKGITNTYNVSVIKQEVTALVITGGSSSWVAEPLTIKIETEGSAASGVKHYEYYKTTSSVVPTDETEATGTTTGNLTITDNGTSYIYYRTVTNLDNRSEWSNQQVVKLDTTEPTLVINSSLPSSVTKGDGYALITKYTTGDISGGSITITSNIDGKIDNDTSTLSVGTHTITCTVTTNAGKSITQTVTVKITYTAYAATNMITNGSFENGTTGFKCYNSTKCPTVVSDEKKYGNSSLYVSSVLENKEVALVTTSSVSIIEGHVYYMKVDTYYKNYTQGYRIAMYVSQLAYLHGVLGDDWTSVSTIAKASSSYITSDIRVGKSYGHTDVVWDGYFDGAFLLDLTETFGSGNEPDKDWCDRHITYFDGSATIYK